MTRRHAVSAPWRSCLAAALVLGCPSRQSAPEPSSTAALEQARTIVAAYATANGLPRSGTEGWTLRVFATQQEMWRAYRQSEEGPGFVGDARPPRPTTVAVPGDGVIFAVAPAELARILPDYAAGHGDAWVRLIAHELAHVWHKQISAGQLGPRWFAEGLAVVVSAQGFGEDRALASAADALRPIDWEDPDAYARAAAAVRYFTARIPVAQLVDRARQDGFEDWLRASAP